MSPGRTSLPSVVQIRDTVEVEDDTWGQFVDTADAYEELVRSSKILSARASSLGDF